MLWRLPDQRRLPVELDLIMLLTAHLLGGFWTPYKAEPPAKIKSWASVTQDELNKLKGELWPIEECDVFTVSSKDDPLDLVFKALPPLLYTPPPPPSSPCNTSFFEGHVERL